ncbi:MAG TPA: Gfo/Idh/MocA family oxidoreductase [Steroidobacteraceae bacterium]|nr:Gfo/Idh/MocA family oxidoreductase [Steroidobacteraceae bacterium]
MKDIKAAVIGTGAAGRFHVQAYRKCPHTEVTAVCSRDSQRAQAFAQEFGVRSYLSIDEMLAKERPDVVTVATLEWEHESPVITSLEAGCHVLCEKIMAHTVPIGERMVAAARRAGRTLGVNYNYRAVPAHALIKEELARGGFGEPALFTARMHTYLWAHLVDLMRYFFGDPAEVVAAIVEDPTVRPQATPHAGRAWMYAADMVYHPSVAASAAFRYRNPDFVATLSGSALVPYSQCFWSFSLYGRRGALTVEAATGDNLAGTPGLGPLALRIRKLPPCSYPQSFDLAVMAFVEALHQGKPPPVSGEDGLAAMRLEAAVAEAARTGRAIALTTPSALAASAPPTAGPTTRVNS